MQHREEDSAAAKTAVLHRLRRPTTSENEKPTSITSEEVSSSIPEKTFEGWQHYPVGFDVDSDAETASFIDGEGYNDRLSKLAPRLFSNNPDDINVEVLEIYEDDTTFNENFTSATRLEQHIVSPKAHSVGSVGGLKVRVISITQKNTQFPLDITEELMRKVLAHYKVSPDFLECLFSYNEKALPSDEGQGQASVTRSSSGDYDISYLLRYAEQNGRSDSPKWSIRRTGVYHRLSPATGTSIFIILHPVRESRFQRLLRGSSSLGKKNTKKLAGHPLSAHLHLLSLHLPDWRTNIRDHGASLLTAENQALTIDPHDSRDYTLSFAALLHLRHFETDISPLKSYFGATLHTIHALSTINEDLENHASYPNIKGRLQIHIARLKAYETSVEALDRRTQAAIKLLAEALDFRNQETAARINELILALTRETVDDSATVRVVTLVTLIYLPATFVATVLGMNIFNMQGSNGPSGSGSGGQQLVVAKEFWIYIATSVPLTMFTVGYWLFTSHRQKKRRAKEVDAQMQEEECGSIFSFAAG